MIYVDPTMCCRYGYKIATPPSCNGVCLASCDDVTRS